MIDRVAALILCKTPPILDCRGGSFKAESLFGMHLYQLTSSKLPSADLVHCLLSLHQSHEAIKGGPEVLGISETVEKVWMCFVTSHSIRS